MEDEGAALDESKAGGMGMLEKTWAVA